LRVSGNTRKRNGEGFRGGLGRKRRWVALEGKADPLSREMHEVREIRLRGLKGNQKKVGKRGKHQETLPV